MEQPIIFTIDNASDFKRTVQITGLGLFDETRSWENGGDLVFRHMLDGEWMYPGVSVKSALTNVKFFSILYGVSVSPYLVRSIAIEAKHNLSDLDLEAQMTSDIKIRRIDYLGNTVIGVACPRYVSHQLNKEVSQVDYKFKLNGFTSMEFILFPQTKLTVYLYEAID